LNEEPCIFVDPTYKVFILFYVDDLQVLYYKDDEALATKFIREIERAYKLRDIKDVKWFLGVRVIRDRAAKKLWLVYDTYIEKISKRF
jgi:hypothetical protein